ncbi:MAG TPA: PSD1 and planctomycete cytochrome C domain-containing protein, partial [Gemmataceae bacterium]|nr:PSD1 and planctomycete cytochrome C domain-containing protein [Gemmataceae bacterium]
MRSTFTYSSFVFFVSFVVAPLRADAPVNYTRDIKPILSSRCYACHGPDEGKRKAKLRLDVRDVAIKKAIKPGEAAGSELIARISSKEPEEVMPPPTAKVPALTPREIDLFKRWIDQGAKFDIHWAYVKPARAALPELKDKSWPRNAIDYFVSAKRQATGLSPAPEADRITLIRRLSFDLTGLPPTPEEVKAFVNDQRPDAYEKLVDRLLASTHYGERMALYWLDLVRFADTGGYHSDNHRDVWLYRDYVIDAFNTNKRFDQFTTEQLAGDLLPNPTREQRIASGYNKLLMTTEEGGAQPKEYTAKYAADRVRNASVVWMAGTMGCAECHDHKYDPYTTKDFYAFEAFFADVEEIAVGRQRQTPLPMNEHAEQLQKLESQVAAARAAFDKQATHLDSAAQPKWEEMLTLPQLRALPPEIRAILLVEPRTRNDKQKQDLAKFFPSVAPQLTDARRQVADAEKRKRDFELTLPTTLVAMSVPPRMVRMLKRGNWLDESGDVVQPAVPAFLGSLDTKDKRASRLDLARWLVAPDNPATARVFVNRLWKLMFGQGLVKTVDDFGAQGQPPSHPELLDWLATEFVKSGWDVKYIVKLMAMSATYRQSSQATKEQRERDPTNLLLARQNRFRLDAEFVRDNALAISGLLSPKVGGPSVKPYQPEGYWQYLNFPK